MPAKSDKLYLYPADLYGLTKIKPLQGGPLSIINGVITPISRVITPVTHLFSAIYRGYNSI